MTRVLHTGDTHIGYQQYHSPERRRDFLQAFETVIDDAIEMDVDAVVHAGDLFQDRRPDLPDLQGTVAALRRLRDAEIPFLAIVGNHEAKRGGQWLDLLADLGLAERLDDRPRIVGDLALYGLDHVPPSARDDLDYDFESHDATHAALVAHGLFEPFDVGNWDSERLLEESSVEFDALLLGDNHEPGRREVGETILTYPGSTERASATEREHRGYNLVDVDDDLSIRRRTIETREFEFVDVTLEAGEGADLVRDRVREYDLEDAVAIVTIEGEGEPITPGPIEELARDRGALIARVNDRREIDAESAEIDVNFADPDEAVRERVREMELSVAARDLDRTIRDPDVPDSTVRERARTRLDEHLDDGLGALAGASETDANDSDAGEHDDPDGDDPDPDAHDDPNGDGDDTDEDDDPNGDGDDTDEDDEPDTNGPTTAEREDITVADEHDTDGHGEAAADGADGQASMEEYL